MTKFLAIKNYGLCKPIPALRKGGRLRLTEGVDNISPSLTLLERGFRGEEKNRPPPTLLPYKEGNGVLVNQHYNPPITFPTEYHIIPV